VAEKNKVADTCHHTKRGRAPPHFFGPCPLWPNSRMDQDATWYGGTLRPGRQCVRCVSSPTKGAQQPPFFGHVYYGEMFAHLSNYSVHVLLLNEDDDGISQPTNCKKRHCQWKICCLVLGTKVNCLLSSYR